MTARKLIAIDLDGTGLTRDKRISPRTKKVLERASRDGHHVVIATGRPPRASMQYYHELALRTPMINFNGAYVHHHHDETWGQHHFPLERETAFSVLEACEKFDIRGVMIEVKDNYYLQQHDHDLMKFAASDGSAPAAIGDLRQLVTEHPTNVLVRPEAARLKEFRDYLDEQHADVIEQRMWGVPYNVIEVVRAGVNKGSSLALVAETLGIEREHVIAFGDEDNDLEMIKWAGYGVAMGNANPMVKAVAKHITDTNDNNGIAAVLEGLL
jgi:5-amino-6-(5-phospho-D-ribitylamino)uracil phosphatase